ncbi:unnamed protein product [Larinioides sclopetarius]|uniref:C2H2-type domain-containing protein n=1 Tax=Larinioides sclopetarius TaxID=280406 RepID=A0AAV2BJ36_9ARAC
MYHINDNQVDNQYLRYEKQQCNNDSFEENMKILINSTELDEEYLEFAVSQGVFNVDSMLYSNELSYWNHGYPNITSIEPALYRNSGIRHIDQDIAINLNRRSFNIASKSVETIGEEHPNSSQKTQILYSNNHQGSFYNMETFQNFHKCEDEMNSFRLRGVEHHIGSYEEHVNLPIIHKENKTPAFNFYSEMMPHMTDNETATANLFFFSQKQKNHHISHMISKNNQTQNYGIRRVGNEIGISNVERSRMEKEMATKNLSEYEMEISDICVGESLRDQYLTPKNIHTPNSHNVSIYYSSLHNEDGQKRRNTENKCHDFTTATSDPKLQLNEKFVLKVGKETVTKEILFPKETGYLEEFSKPSVVYSMESHVFKNRSDFGNSFLKQQSDERSDASDVSTKHVKQMCTFKKSMLNNRGQKSFRCEICKKSFSRKHNLKQHSRIHSGVKPFTCNICHKAFFYKCNLVTHLRTHSDDNPFTCDICHKAFFSKFNLLIHFRIHSGDKPFSCNICHKAFTRKYNMMQHVRTHSGEKPFSCDICHRAFVSGRSLAKHARTHSGEEPFSCDIWNTGFSYEHHLKKLIHT